MFKPPAETPQEFQARISKQREEQIIAEERRQREAAARKARVEQEREAGMFSPHYFCFIHYLMPYTSI